MKMHLIMMRLGLLVVLLMAHICKGDRVKFTNTNNRQQPLTGITGPANPVNVSTRFFGNYLGLVSALGTLLPSQTVSVAQTSFPSGSVAPSDLQCECVATAECPSILRTNPNTRIVTQCPSGQVLCCLAENEITCGIPQVISGVTPAVGQANLGEYPWSAVILTLEDNQFVGGGALIDELHIITVAHRVYTIANPATIKVRLGDWDLSANYEPVRHLERRVTRIVVHPNFDRATLRNDIAILFLSSEVPLLSSQYPQINSVCLPESDDDFTGNRCWTAGWGKDTYTGNYQNIIKEVDLPVISPATCQSVLRQILGNNYVLDPNSFICAGGGANKDSCVGDGGNALTCTINGQSYVAGLTAGGIRCGIEAVPALYVNVPNYVTWINRVIAPALVIEPRRG